MTLAHPPMSWKKKLLIAVIAGVTFLLITSILGFEVAKQMLGWMADQRSPEMLWISAVIFTVLLAIPGIPGIEIGLMMMVLFGTQGILTVYLCTCIGLNIAFGMGRILSRKQNPEPSSPDSSLQDSKSFESVLTEYRAGRWILKFANTEGRLGRYVVIFFLFNLPGNFILGGGGGIAMICGANRKISWFGYFITVLLAASLFPLVAYFGLIQVDELVSF